ncbi:MAG: spore germination protein [Ruminococcaceae bacterium]|nr:spore germination protein [Oscillospiraceae bacterium]
MQYREMTAALEATLRLEKSFDLQKRPFRAVNGSVEAVFYSLSGSLDSEMAEKMMTFAMTCRRAEDCVFNVPHPDVSQSDDVAALADAVLTGRAVMAVEGVEKAAVIDCKSYSLRAVSEPENDRVLRGPRDGFSESLVRNTALIRRRLRDPALVMERFTVGDPSGTDVALCYVEGKASAKLVDTLRDKLSGMKIRALNMTQESLAEAIIPRGWYNPFPKVRFTERPDAAAAMLEEGSVILVCDNTPQVMILPTAIFDFLQETDDFYLPPLIGSYLRLTRMGIFLLSLILTPLWYYCVKNIGTLPPWLGFLDVKEPAAIPLLMQLLLAEFMIDGLKLASLNTPNMLNNSLSVVGGLILGDYAVEAGWFSSQTILYMAIVAIASFTQQSYELGYAFKFLRILLLLAVELFGLWGLIGGLILTVVAIAGNRTVEGSRSYLYPLIPFHGKALMRMFFRVRLKKED